MTTTRLENIRKIAVLRANGLGDYLFAVPALQALKTAYPDAELVYLGCPWHKSLLENRPGPVDRVLVVPVSRGVRTEPGRDEDPRELDAFFESARRENFDLALQIHGGGRNSNPFLLRLDARITAGLATPDAPRLDITIPYIFYQSEVMRYLEVVRAVGATPTSVVPTLAVTPADVAAIDTLLGPMSSPLIVLHPGATDHRRRWSPEKFARVGDHFAARGATVAITGTGNERLVVDSVAANMIHPALNLYQLLSWPALVGLMARADLLISNDSGPLHLAAATGTPTVGLFWCGNVILGAPFMRQCHRPAISWMVRCPDCGTNIADAGFPFQPTRTLQFSESSDAPVFATCEHPHSFVDPIQINDVISSATDLLEAARESREALH